MEDVDESEVYATDAHGRTVDGRADAFVVDSDLHHAPPLAVSATAVSW